MTTSGRIVRPDRLFSSAMAFGNDNSMARQRSLARSWQSAEFHSRLLESRQLHFGVQRSGPDSTSFFRSALSR